MTTKMNPQRSSIIPIALFLTLISLGIFLSFVIDNQNDVQRFSFVIAISLGVGLGATFLTGKITGGGKFGFLNLKSISGGFLLFLITVILFIKFFPIQYLKKTNSRIKTNFSALKINEPISFWAENTSEAQLGFEWYINNKKTSTGNPFKTNFPEEGTYTVKLITVDSSGSTDADELTIQVNPLGIQDINIVLMDTFEPGKIYKDKNNTDSSRNATGETNSHIIKRILDSHFDTVRPRMFIELTKQEYWAFDRQVTEIRNYKPHLVIIHRSAFRSEPELMDFIKRLDTTTKIFIYSRTFKYPNEVESFKNKLAEKVTDTSRVTIFRFVNDNTFFDVDNKSDIKKSLENLIGKIKNENNGKSPGK